ncbi:hypothetical protein [Massilia sp. DWR3-1-1]|uniref:hypothetical protein n=1 Tax=Massilia sp. DWR3-1-1 TaxID=2804559 RepID=UPI003CF89A52
MNRNFDDFYAGLAPQRPSPQDGQELLPVRGPSGDLNYFYDAVSDTSASALNWALHAIPYLEALAWFKAMHHYLPQARVEQNYAQLPLLAKVIIERGYCIENHRAFPPLFFGNRYLVELEVDESSIEFPVRRIDEQKFFGTVCQRNSGDALH